MTRIAIFSVGDSRYLPVELVALSSIKRLNPGYDYIAFVPKDSPGIANWVKYENQLGIRIEEVDFAEYFTPRSFGSEWWPLECLMWFVVPAILHAMGYSHSLYVDGDILCLKSLNFQELLDREECIIGIDNGPARRQLAHIDCIEQLLSTKLATENIATNTGVLFFRNVDLVESSFANRVRELYALCWPWALSEINDQALFALYLAVYDIKMGIIDPSWNLRLSPDGNGLNLRQLRAYYSRTYTPNIIHFLGGKPWADQKSWASAASVRIEAANHWRNLAVETLGSEIAGKAFGPQVLSPVKTQIGGLVHGYLLESVLSHIARKAMRKNEALRMSSSAF